MRLRIFEKKGLGREIREEFPISMHGIGVGWNDLPLVSLEFTIPLEDAPQRVLMIEMSPKDAVKMGKSLIMFGENAARDAVLPTPPPCRRKK